MDKVLNYIKGRKVNFYLYILAFIFAIVSIILYVNSGVNEFSTSLNSLSLAFTILGIISFVPLLFIKKVKIIYYLPYLFLLFGFLEYLVSQARYIANILVSIDGTTFSSAFITTVVMYLISIVLSLVAALLTKEEKKKEKDVVEIKEQNV